MEDFLDQYGYFALLTGTFLEGETAILLASSLIHKGTFGMPQTISMAFLGSFISDWLYYLIGRLNGKYFIEKRPRLQAKVAPVTAFLQRNKIQILFSYRFLYGFRIIIPLMIGMSKVKPQEYLVFTFITGLIWASIVSSVGYFVGRLFNVTVPMLESNFLFIVAGFALLGLSIGFIVKRFAMGNNSGS